MFKTTTCGCLTIIIVGDIPHYEPLLMVIHGYTPYETLATCLTIVRHRNTRWFPLTIDD